MPTGSFSFLLNAIQKKHKHKNALTSYYLTSKTRLSRGSLLNVFVSGPKSINIDIKVHQ
jgi:hypothetical protein